MNEANGSSGRPSPWTQAVLVHWPRSVRFYRQRFAFLERLEGEGLLTAFRTSDGGDTVEARLGGGFAHEIEVWPGGLLVRMFTRRPDRELVERAASLACELVAPEGLLSLHIFIQYLRPIRDDYDKARAASAQMMLSDVGIPAEVTDWAMLLDARSQKAPWLTFQAEFGVVRKEEIGDRLARRAGRTGSPVREGPWDPKQFPDVAFFVDGSWKSSKRVEGAKLLERLWEARGLALEEGSDIVQHLEQRFGFDVDLNNGDEGVRPE